MIDMWLFYGYKFLLPVLIAITSLFIFITWREDRVHHGWWLAFLFFSLSLALAIPVKANPFQNNLNNYEESKKIVQQINGLYSKEWLEPVILKENITKKDIENFENKIKTLSSKGQQKKAKKAIETAWDGWNNQQAALFFAENLGWESDVFYDTPHLSTINVDSIPQAHKLLDKLKGSSLRSTLANFLDGCEELIASEDY
ncbi:hypothetical protein P7H60_14525 [Vagococcus carniphilus]|uniref:hypothetical protein n=1 Tax=Vagococcus carniphilus TaxID=218144 RepID=UPI0028904607|nr:hypothetical protein [Vagococcus carniphilus]MDT2850367.1 hypothetical protein [Vagococcus carniphilus]